MTFVTRGRGIFLAPTPCPGNRGNRSDRGRACVSCQGTREVLAHRDGGRMSEATDMEIVEAIKSLHEPLTAPDKRASSMNPRNWFSSGTSNPRQPSSSPAAAKQLNRRRNRMVGTMVAEPVNRPPVLPRECKYSLKIIVVSPLGHGTRISSSFRKKSRVCVHPVLPG